MLKKILTAALIAVMMTISINAVDAGTEGNPTAATAYLVCFRDGYNGNTDGMTLIHENLYRVEDLSLLEGLEADIEYLEEDIPVAIPILPEEEKAMLAAASPAGWQVKMVNPEPVWALNTYGQTVRVGIIDTGCNNHDQLTDVLCGGWNYLSNNDDYSDAQGHGTHVAGIIAASAGDYLSGIAPKTEIYALRCWGSSGTASLSVLARALYGAVDDFGCQVVNMSFMTGTDSAALRAAIEYAHQKGVILCGAAGNKGDGVLQYPGAYPEVICVASVGENKEVSDFSSYFDNVFVAAPGERYISSYINPPTYLAMMSGTSQACPVVTGAVALMLSMEPSLTDADLRRLIADTAEDLGAPGRDIHYGYGLINIAAMAEELLKDRIIYVSPVDPESNTAILYNLSPSTVRVFLFRSLYQNNRYYSGSRSWKDVVEGQKITLSLKNWSAGEILHVLGGLDGFMPIMTRPYT